jgi:hypothetical protein
MRRLTLNSQLSTLALLLLLLCGCSTTGTAPSVTGTIRTPDVIYSTPGKK